MLGSAIGHGHEHWLFTSKPQYEIGDSIQVYLRSGHSNDRSEFRIKTEIIQEAFVIQPDGQQISLDFKPVESEHTCSFLASQIGPYTLIVNLRKRPQGPFNYLLKSYVQVGTTGTTWPIGGQILEILHGNGVNSLLVSANGDHVRAPIGQMSNQVNSLSMDSNGLSNYHGNTGDFLITICHYRRQTTTMSFYCREE